MSCATLIIAAAASLLRVSCLHADDSTEVTKLAEEVRGMGWIVSATISPRGDWDLYPSCARRLGAPCSYADSRVE